MVPSTLSKASLTIPITKVASISYVRWTRDSIKPISLVSSESQERYIRKSAARHRASIPGLGNGVCQDILFNARISPKRKISTLSEEDIDRLFNTVKSTLEEMTRRGGRDTEKDLYGALGNYRTILSKNTYHDPCPVCGERIQKEAYLGGSIYYCPHCQRER